MCLLLWCGDVGMLISMYACDVCMCFMCVCGCVCMCV